MPESFHYDIGPVVRQEIQSATDDLQERITKSVGVTSRLAIEAISNQLRDRTGLPAVPNAFPPVAVHPKLILALARLHPQIQELAFKSPQQAEVLQLLSDGQPGYTLFVSPTGGGKTGVVLAAAVLNDNKTLVAITPMISSTQDLYRRVKEVPGIVAACWDDRLDNLPPPNCSLMVVSAHHVNSHDFKDYIRCLGSRLHAIVLDEAHELCISGYRKTFEYFHYLTALNAPLFFLTATMLPRTESRLCNILMLDRRLLRVIRMNTARTNIAYRVEKYADIAEAVARVQALMTTIKLTPGQKGLIYCQTKADVEALALRLGLPYYHASLDPTDEARNKRVKRYLHREWIESTDPRWAWMVCTLAFGIGIDHPRVRCVLHLAMPSLLRYIQESGRAGRDDEPCVCYVLSYPCFRRNATEEDLHLADREGVMYAETNDCRRLILGIFDREQHSCAALGAELCDNCLRMLEVGAHHEQPTKDLSHILSGCVHAHTAAHSPRRALRGRRSRHCYNTRSKAQRSTCRRTTADDADPAHG